MILVKQKADSEAVLNPFRQEGKTIGFVPTMGALHAGHISLIDKSKRENDICVCSIFINPTQFNNASDLVKYPVTIEKDIDMLEKAGCDILFLPSVSEMYPAGEVQEHYNLGSIETVLEGAFRPGHFQGVAVIVDKLLAAVKPDTLYLGRKDYQQCMVIRKMMDLKGHHAMLRIADTVREKDGLAMSSRNMRLNTSGRKRALRIIEALTMVKAGLAFAHPEALKTKAVLFLQAYGFTVDYVEIADAATLAPLDRIEKDTRAVVLAAAYLDEVRLIDNVVL